MASSSHTLSIRKPISVWNTPLKADFKDLFKALSKVVIHGIAGNWATAGHGAAEALSAIGFEHDPGQVAWLLIRRALTKAVFDLVGEHRDLFPQAHTRELEAVCEVIDLSLEYQEICIDRTFFDRPDDFILLDLIRLPLGQWLERSGLPQAQAQAIGARLRSYFVFALNDEWCERAKEYEVIQQTLETPFTKADQREQGWIRYEAWLHKQIDERMFYETFGLRQIYVPLRAWYAAKGLSDVSDDLEDRIRHDTQEKRIVIDLEAALSLWLERADSTDAVRVISGGPGSGKSSFAKMFAASQAAKGSWRVLFIPLHLFAVMDDLVEAVGRFVQEDGLLTHHPLEPQTGDRRILLIFDGLDELAMQGKVAEQMTQLFVREVFRTLDRLNLHGTRLHALLSGREVVVQANAGEFRKSGQILHILPYYLSYETETRATYEDTRRLLAHDQRQLWWKYYGDCTGQAYTAMPNALMRRELEDITAQPLLNYLLALSFARGQVDFARETNLNAIYGDLLQAVYERGWAGYQHPVLQGINEQDFVRILEEIGVAAWHGDGRTTTVREIESYCDHSGLRHLLATFQEGVQAGVTRLLTAFYFRQRGYRQDGERTFEFTHKSFGEYLTARRLIRAVRRVTREIERRQRDPDEGWDEREALRHWCDLCGPTVMTTYLFTFIDNEIRLCEEPEVTRWQQVFCQLIGFMLKHGMPLERLTPRPSYLEEHRQARNAEEALLAIANACARMTHTMNKIIWPSFTALGDWLSKLRAQRIGTENTLALQCLSWLDAQKQLLYGQDLLAADLSYSSLQEASLSFAQLQKAHLQEAHLQRAHLQEAHLREAHLREADLQGADLREAHLREADLQWANLREADLQGAQLQGAQLQGADLQGAQLQRADLQGADLREADLQGADLQGAHLREAHLREADLQGVLLQRAHLREAQLQRAHLQRADLRRAQLQEAHLQGAHLQGANLRGAQLQRADLRGAHLQGADLREADLQGADLQGAHLQGADLQGARR